MQSAADAAQPTPNKAAVRYAVDVGRSTFTLQVFSTGLLSAFGHSPKIAAREIQGEVQFVATGTTLEDARLHLTIHAGSLQVIDDISDKDRREIQRQMYDEVLEVDRFPEIQYECSRVTFSGNGDRYWAALNGELTLHGETHPLQISARVVISGDKLRASGEFGVKQSEYGIAPVSVAGGAIKLKDEIKCTFDIVAQKQG
ncbi:MAG: YceI family protein [Candidatus Korobacteraceae bacterium]